MSKQLRLDEIKKALINAPNPEITNLARFLFKRTIIPEINDIITDRYAVSVSVMGDKLYKITIDFTEHAKVSFVAPKFDYKTGPKEFGFNIAYKINPHLSVKKLAVIQSKILNLANTLDLLVDDFSIRNTYYLYSKEGKGVQYDCYYRRDNDLAEYHWVPGNLPA